MVDGVRGQRFPLARNPVAEASNKLSVNATILLLVTTVSTVLASRRRIANATNNRVPVRIVFVVSIDKC